MNGQKKVGLLVAGLAVAGLAAGSYVIFSDPAEEPAVQEKVAVVKPQRYQAQDNVDTEKKRQRPAAVAPKPRPPRPTRVRPTEQRPDQPKPQRRHDDPRIQKKEDPKPPLG